MEVSQGSFAAITSALAVAGVGEFAPLEALPKGALIFITSALLVMVWAFVRRDAIKYKTRFDAVEKAMEDTIRQAQFRVCMDLVRENDKRITILETKSGMHG